MSSQFHSYGGNESRKVVIGDACGREGGLWRKWVV